MPDTALLGAVQWTSLVPQLPQLAPLNLEVQWLYYETLLDCLAPLSIMESKLKNPMEDAPLPVLMTLSFSHSQFMVTGEDRAVPWKVLITEMYYL